MGFFSNFFGSSDAGMTSWSVNKLRNEQDKYVELMLKAGENMWADLSKVEEKSAVKKRYADKVAEIVVELKRRGLREMEPLADHMKRKGHWK